MQLRPKTIEPRKQAIKPDSGVGARETDDRVDRIWPFIAKAQPQLVRQIAKLIAAFDQAPCGKRDQQSLCARGVASGGLRLNIKPGEPLFRRRETLIEPALLLGHTGDDFDRLLNRFFRRIRVFNRFGQRRWRRRNRRAGRRIGRGAGFERGGLLRARRRLLDIDHRCPKVVNRRSA